MSVLATALLALTATIAPASPTVPAASPTLPPDPGHAVPRDSLRWGPCEGAADPALACAPIDVPLDWSHPEGRHITVTLSRIRAGDPARRRGVLVTTGGGPGGPGVPLPSQLAASLPDTVTDQFDLVGFDPRFIERSTPLSCGAPGEESGGYWIRSITEGFERNVADARAYAEGCVRTSGWALPHATTEAVARDMDAIRSALGEKRISYLGGSWAAKVGAAYAALFPGRVDRMVLDSPPDPALNWQEFELERTPGFDRGVAALTVWLAEHDDEYGLGTTVGDVDLAFRRLLTDAMAEPLVVSGTGVPQTWNADRIMSVVLDGIFFDQRFPSVGETLAALIARRAPATPEQSGDAEPVVANLPPDNHSAANLAYRCSEAPWPTDPQRYLDDVNRLSRTAPLYGQSLPNIVPCAFWPQVPDSTVDNTPDGTVPVLVVAATRDVSVPLVNAERVHSRLAGSRLVTVDAQTHVPFVGRYGSACLDAPVMKYLTDGTLPAADMFCMRGR